MTIWEALAELACMLSVHVALLLYRGHTWAYLSLRDYHCRVAHIPLMPTAGDFLQGLQDADGQGCSL